MIKLYRIFKLSKVAYKLAQESNADIYHFHDPELLRIGLKLSRKGKKVIYQMAKGEKVSFESSGLSKREWNELMASFDFTEKIV